MKATILVVDDDAKYLTFLDRALKRGGFRVLTASDGCEVPELLATARVDVLVMDLQMPGMNGWELLRALREQSTLQPPADPNDSKRMKIVVVSGRCEDETAAFVRRLGADAYLTKPFWSEQILATVREVLAH
jgi:two-component system, OmpR family, response regulator